MSMIFDRDIDNFIDTTILRYSSEHGNAIGRYIIYLRDYQSRITDKLVDDCLSACRRRGLQTERIRDTVYVTVNLDNCTLSRKQAYDYRIAVEYIRNTYGRNL